MADIFQNDKITLNAPAASAAAVTPSDTVNLPNFSRALYIGGSGSVAVIMADRSTTATFVGAVAGSILPIRVSRVLTATTATSIVALY